MRRLVSVTGLMGLIIPCRSGVFYTSQCGGFACRHPKVEGAFIPITPGRFFPGNLALFPELAESEFLDELDKAIGLRSSYGGWCDNGITKEDADRLDAIFAKYKLPWRVDRTKLAKCMEAWIHVVITDDVEEILEGFKGEHAIFVHPNSD